MTAYVVLGGRERWAVGGLGGLPASRGEGDWMKSSPGTFLGLSFCCKCSVRPLGLLSLARSLLFLFCLWSPT